MADVEVATRLDMSASFGSQDSPADGADRGVSLAGSQPSVAASQGDEARAAVEAAVGPQTEPAPPFYVVRSFHAALGYVVWYGGGSALPVGTLARLEGLCQLPAADLALLLRLAVRRKEWFALGAVISQYAGPLFSRGLVRRDGTGDAGASSDEESSSSGDEAGPFGSPTFDPDAQLPARVGRVGQAGGEVLEQHEVTESVDRLVAAGFVRRASLAELIHATPEDLARDVPHGAPLPAPREVAMAAVRSVCRVKDLLALLQAEGIAEAPRDRPTRKRSGTSGRVTQRPRTELLALAERHLDTVAGAVWGGVVGDVVRVAPATRAAVAAVFDAFHLTTGYVPADDAPVSVDVPAGGGGGPPSFGPPPPLPPPGTVLASLRRRTPAAPLPDSPLLPWPEEAAEGGGAVGPLVHPSAPAAFRVFPTPTHYQQAWAASRVELKLWDMVHGDDRRRAGDPRFEQQAEDIDAIVLDGIAAATALQAAVRAEEDLHGTAADGTGDVAHGSGCPDVGRAPGLETVLLLRSAPPEPSASASARASAPGSPTVGSPASPARKRPRDDNRNVAPLAAVSPLAEKLMGAQAERPLREGECDPEAGLCGVAGVDGTAALGQGAAKRRDHLARMLPLWRWLRCAELLVALHEGARRYPRAIRWLQVVLNTRVELRLQGVAPEAGSPSSRGPAVPDGASLHCCRRALSLVYRPHRRCEWHHRLVLDLVHSNRQDAALAHCEALVGVPTAQAFVRLLPDELASLGRRADRLAIERTLVRLHVAPRRWNPVPARRLLLPALLEPPVVTFAARRDPRQRGLWLPPAGCGDPTTTASAGVEETSLRWYLRQLQQREPVAAVGGVAGPEWRGLHCEGSWLQSLFSVALFAAARSDCGAPQGAGDAEANLPFAVANAAALDASSCAWMTPFQRLPLDARAPSFHGTRRAAIGAAIARLRAQTPAEFGADIAAFYAERTASGVPGVSSSLPLAEIAAAFPSTEPVARLLETVAAQRSGHAVRFSGVPDLLIWRHVPEGWIGPAPRVTEDKLSSAAAAGVVAVEVKSPTDKLSEKQRAMNDCLLRCGVHVHLCLVKEQGGEPK